MGAKEQEIVPLHAGFDVVYRGFHRRQVIDHIENLEEQLRFTSMDRAEALAQSADLRKLLESTRSELDEARTRIGRLEASPVTHAGATERMHRMLRLAEDEAAELRLQADRDVADLRQRVEAELTELRARAVREATEIRGEAEAEAHRLHQACASRAAQLDQREVDLERRSSDLEAQHAQRATQVEEECAAAMKQAQDDANRLLRETAEQCNRLELESEHKREKAQQIFDETITRRTNEITAHLAEQEKLAKARAEFVVKLACREAQRRIAEIQEKSEELKELRRTVQSQLASARAALSMAAERVGPMIPEQVTAQEQVAAS
ncbi:chromosome segregation protein [Lentzea sp. NBRC 105346]|uniref:hypothetical protein n=1 Tax=Lentzea sp. NBRC 105346 TaxID=3032205 RepID=UPI0024A28452|nr:hypothetical protein [Lentzea sp. NBRC 105346]GLZ35400.1 chromosome segregation protein [Lentzea sp. NBRC 105346]